MSYSFQIWEKTVLNIEMDVRLCSRIDGSNSLNLSKSPIETVAAVQRKFPRAPIVDYGYNLTVLICGLCWSLTILVWNAYTLF